MKLKKFLLGLVFILAVSLQACGAATSTPTNDDEPERLSTAVAGTLTAQASIPTQTNTPTPTDTSTLSPTRTPGPLRVVYSRGGSIWIWTEGGKPKQLTNNIVDERPRISDDGQLVVFERNNELYAVHSDGSNLHVLVSDAFLKPYIPQGYKFIWAEFYDWAPNSHLVYFSTKTGISGPKTDIYQYDLFRADVDSGEVKQVVAPGSGGMPYFSVDGKTIAMSQPTAIYLASPDGAGIRKVLEFPLAADGGVGDFFPSPISLSNGKTFRVMIPEENWYGSTSASAKIWNIPTEGQPVLIISSIQGVTPLSLYTLSNNGKAIGFTLSNDNDSFQNCIVYNIETKATATPDYCIPIQAKASGFLNWSPNNHDFVYAAYEGEAGTIFYLAAEDRTPTRLETSDYMQWIDSNRYIYGSLDGNLYLANIDGNQIWLDKGVNVINGVGPGYRDWPFDFSN